MKLKHIASVLILLGIIFSGVLSAQKSVKVTITKESNGRTIVKDTSFSVNDVSEIDGILEQMGVGEAKPNQTIEKKIVIREANETAGLGRITYSSGKPMLGVYLMEVDDVDRNKRQDLDEGVYITNVTKGGGAERAGLQKGDIIVRLEGEKVDDVRGLGRIKQKHKIGDNLQVTYYRDGRAYTRDVRLTGRTQTLDWPGMTLTSSPPAPPSPVNQDRAFLGVVPHNVSESRANQMGLSSTNGIYISSVVRNSGAEGAGMMRGDVITEMDGMQVANVDALRKVLRSKKAGDALSLVVWRDGDRHNLTAKLTRSGESLSANSRPRIRVQEQRAYMGVYLNTHSSNDEGVKVTSLVDGGAAEEAGVKSGEYITSIGGNPTPDYKTLTRVMKEMRPGEKVAVELRKGSKTRTVNLKLKGKTTTRWVLAPVEDKIDIDVVIREFEDPAAGETLKKFMEDPDLDMDNFTLYPNPNNGRFTLAFEPEERGDVVIKIYSTGGEVVFQETLKSFGSPYEKEIDLSNRSKGVYFLQVTQNGSGMAKRIVVR
ncbi:MAG: PDZ domain-containing protein [Bacteroidota bacterium]